MSAGSIDADLYLFNVGHGSSCFLEIEQMSKDPYRILVDGGTKSADVVGKLDQIIGLTTPIDLVVLTHIHKDHCNGLIEFMRHWEGDIRQLWIPYPTRFFSQLADALVGEGKDLSPEDLEKLGGHEQEGEGDNRG